MCTLIAMGHRQPEPLRIKCIFNHLEAVLSIWMLKAERVIKVMKADTHIL